MRIEPVPEAKPFKCPPYRSGTKTRKLERAEIDKQSRARMIESAMSDLAVLVLIVSKKDEKLPFCIDYRRLSSMMVKDTCPLLRTYECINTLENNEYFTTLSAYSGYG